MTSLKRRLALGALFLLAIAALVAQPENSRQIFGEIDRSLAELTRVSGLKIRKKVSYDLIDRDKVNQFLRDRVKEAVKPEELRAEELTLKKLGFVPADFDLEKSTVDLLTEQAAAFYDFHRKKLFLTDWAPSTMQEGALVHELAHALADQNFHLERFIRKGGNSDDSGLARMAVMEGQATWLMTEVLARKRGQSIATNPALLDAMSGATESGASQFPVFNRVPLYLRETLIFPYTEGARFQDALFQKMGIAAFAEIFRHPPVSTQQVLHAEKYFNHVSPTFPSLPRLAAGPGYKKLVEGMIGELDHAILLRQYEMTKQASDIAPHWRGGRYSLLENVSKNQIILAYVSEWDGLEAAREFFQCYRQILQRKWKKMEVTSEDRTSLAGVGDDGSFLVRWEENRVTSVEGMASPSQAKRASMR